MEFYAFTIIATIFMLLIVQIDSQSIEDEFSNPCTHAESCGSCIRLSDKCAWCSTENHPRGVPRCDILANLKRHCPEKDISNPLAKSTITKDAQWTSGDQNKPPVQVKPQEISFTLRPNELVKFQLSFKQQSNYPVDLYFLLDLSYGIGRDIEAQQRLISLGRDIPISMQNITNNFKLGFGTFVDKLLMPYIAWTPEMQKYRCQKPVCRDPHDFKNQVNLGEDQASFGTKMKEALEFVSVNLDDDEGGLDALIQALDCDQEIGWRDVSRRIIVYCSNSLFHLAGDGKLGGATKHSNLKCGLNSKNEYEYEKLYDYPSVSQVASKLREKKANVIFAVMGNVVSDYEKLRSFLDGAVVGELEKDSKNIVQLISNKYYELRSRIKFQPNNADFVEIKFSSKCLSNIVRETAVCENLEINDQVEFEVKLIVKSDVCNGKSGVVERNVTLDAVGLNDQLFVKLNILCDCECERAGKEIPNSDKCNNGNGTFECGMCNCNPGRYGRKCECDESEISSRASLEQCLNKNETVTCSGNGECICGVCQCYTLTANTAQRYSGDYCQCNDYSCPIGANGLCGGSTRGTCNCGKCFCINDWTGDDCECTSDNSTCIATNGEICNAAGSCKCGKCVCHKNSTFVGPTCEDCPTCQPKCSEHIDCAQCKAHGTGKYNREDCDRECGRVVLVDTLESRKGIRNCEGIDVDGCTFFFTYEYSVNNDVIIKSQKTKDCPAEANIAAIVGGTVAAVVLIPLLIICLIIFIRNRRDAKEYADFMKEREKARWDSGGNPIYKDPKSTFQNPTYKGIK